MRPAAAAFALFALLAQSENPASADEMTLVLSHPLRAGEIAWIEVQVGPIGRGQEIDVTTAAGQELGVISPFGVRRGQDAGTYTLPVPGDAIRDGRFHRGGGMGDPVHAAPQFSSRGGCCADQSPALPWVRRRARRGAGAET